MTTRKYDRIAPGDYQSDDGVRIYRIPGVQPAAWNAYYVDPSNDQWDNDIVDGAASFSDAKAIADATVPA